MADEIELADYQFYRKYRDPESPWYIPPPTSGQAAADLVTFKFDEALLRTNQLMTSAQEQFQTMESFLMAVQPLELFPEFEDPAFIQYALTAGNKPTAPSIAFPALTVPDLATPQVTFDYQQSAYQSELREKLKRKLYDLVDNGGTGLGADVEEALFERDRLRREQARRDSIDRIQAEWASESAGDLGLPDGALAALYQTVETEHLQKEQEVSHSTAIKMAELARQQQEVALTAGVQLEQVMAAKHGEDEKIALDAAKAEPEVIIRMFEAAVAKVKIDVEAYNAIAIRANVELEKYKAEVTTYVSDGDIAAKTLQASVDKYDAEVRAKAAKSEAFSRVDANRINQMQLLSNLQMEALKSLAQMQSTLAAAFATSVSASASLGGQHTQSISDSTSVSKSWQRVETSDRTNVIPD